MTRTDPQTKTSVIAGPEIFPRLGEWFLNTAVAALVWEAVKRFQIKNLRPVAPPSAGLAFQPVNLLAILTFSYAVGVYGSQDVERMMREDGHFRNLCRNEFPNWHTIRRFRRYNNEAIRHCLAETFRLAGSLNSPSATENLKISLNSNPTTGIEEGVSVDGCRSEQEAADRVERAMWIDQMAMDDNEF
jgi:hypothetical protein